VELLADIVRPEKPLGGKNKENQCQQAGAGAAQRGAQAAVKPDRQHSLEYQHGDADEEQHAGGGAGNGGVCRDQQRGGQG